MITKKTIAEVFERCNGLCENPTCGANLYYGYENHHIYWRSQYKGDDRDLPWNIAAVCKKCHYSIHSQANTGLDRLMKGIANMRLSVSLRSTTKNKDSSGRKKQAKAKYRKELAAFKDSHDGLSPHQVKYRQWKERNAMIREHNT